MISSNFIKLSVLKPRHLGVGVFCAMHPEYYGASSALVSGEGYVPAQHGTRIYLHCCADVTDTLERIVHQGALQFCPKPQLSRGDMWRNFWIARETLLRCIALLLHEETACLYGASRIHLRACSIY
jgi:hypothetical protein